MNNPRNGEWAKRRNGEAPDWWDEAPERSGTPSKVIGTKLLDDAVRPESPPSRNIARITARRVLRTDTSIVVPISLPCGYLQSFRSLAPPSLSPIRRLALSPP